MFAKGLVEGEETDGGCDVIGDRLRRKGETADSSREERSDGRGGEETEGRRCKSIGSDVGLCRRRKSGDINRVVLMAFDVVERERERYCGQEMLNLEQDVALREGGFRGREVEAGIVTGETREKGLVVNEDGKSTGVIEDIEELAETL